MKLSALPMPSDDEFESLSNSISGRSDEEGGITTAPQIASPTPSSGIPMPSDDDFSGLQEEIELARPKGYAEEVLDFLKERAKETGAGLVGTGQGLTLNFGDELLAGLEYAAKGGTEPYQDIQKRYEEGYAALKREHPLSTTLGEIGGGIAIPGGAVMGAGKAGAGLLGRALAGGVTGGITSGLAELGATEKDISKPGELEKELPELEQAAALGFGLGAGIPVAGAALKKLPIKEYIDQSPMIRRWIEAYKLESGKRTGAPVNLTETALKTGGRQAGSQKVLERVDEITKPIIEPIIKIKNKLAEEIKTTLDANVNAIPNLRQQAPFQELTTRLQAGNSKLWKEFEDILVEQRMVLDPNTGKTRNQWFFKRNISPSELNESYNIVKSLKPEDLTGMGFRRKDINFLNLHNGQDSLKGLLNQLLEANVPALANAKKQFYETSRLGELILNEIKSDPNAIVKSITSFEDEELRTLLQKMLVNKIKTAGSVSTASDVAMKDIYDILDNLVDYNKLLSKGAKKSGKKPFDVADLEEQIKERAEGYGALVGSKGIDAVQDAPSQAVVAAFKDPGVLASMTLSSGLQVAGKAGRLTTKAPVKGMIEGYDKMYAGAEKMANSSSIGTRKLGETLKSALDNKMGAGSVSALNTLLQSNAEARMAMRSLYEGSEYDEENPNFEEPVKGSK